MFYNVSNGYVEGIVRGYRNTLLTGTNYGNLVQCETIDGETPSSSRPHNTHMPVERTRDRTLSPLKPRLII